MNTKQGAFGRFFYACKLVLSVVRAYAFNLFVAVDQALNAVIGGDPAETISSRLGKGKRAKKPVHTFLARCVNLIFEILFDQDDHCDWSIQHDEGKHAISEVINRYHRGEPQLWRL